MMTSAEVRLRREERAARADDDVVAAVADLVPQVEVLAEGEAAVQHGDLPGKRSAKRRTVCGVSEISGTSTIARLPSSRARSMAAR